MTAPEPFGKSKHEWGDELNARAPECPPDITREAYATLAAKCEALEGQIADLDAGYGLLMDLYRRHMKAAQNDDEPTRARLFALIEEFEWAFPAAKAAADARYPRAAPREEGKT